MINTFNSRAGTKNHEYVTDEKAAGITNLVFTLYNSYRHIPEKPVGRNVSIPRGVAICCAQKKTK